MSKRLNVYKDQKPIYDIVMEPSFEKLTEEVNKFHLTELQDLYCYRYQCGSFISGRSKRTFKQML